MTNPQRQEEHKKQAPAPDTRDVMEGKEMPTGLADQNKHSSPKHSEAASSSVVTSSSASQTTSESDARQAKKQPTRTSSTDERAFELKKKKPGPVRGRPKGRKTTRHPDLIRPKRPRTAYNLFFQDERNKMLQQAGVKDESADRTTPRTELPMTISSQHQNGKKKRGRPPGPNSTRRRQNAPKHGVIGFAELAKTIGARWQSIDAASKKHYEELAAADLEDYKKAMKLYNEEVEKLEQGKKDGAEEEYASKPSELHAAAVTVQTSESGKRNETEDDENTKMGAVRDEPRIVPSSRSIGNTTGLTIAPSIDQVLPAGRNVYDVDSSSAMLPTLLQPSIINQQTGRQIPAMATSAAGGDSPDTPSPDGVSAFANRPPNSREYDDLPDASFLVRHHLP